MFSTYIFAVLLLKYCYLTGGQLKNIALQILSYSSQADYNCYQVIVNFVYNFVGMATGAGRKKMQFAAFDGLFLKTFYKRKKFAKVFYAN